MERRLFATRKRRTPSETGSWSVLPGRFRVLDYFHAQCCIRNEAEKSIKIFKIVVSGLPLASRICISNGRRRHFSEIINNLQSLFSPKLPALV